MATTRSAIPLVFCLFSFAVGCGDSYNSPTSPSVNVPFSAVDLRAGTGTEAALGRFVTVHYTGWLYDANQASRKGRQFDSSVGAAPFSFVLGAGQVIRGWDQGFVGMKVGGQRQLIIPPELGYGSAGAGGGAIPPNATLIFDVELLAVQ